MFQRIYPTKDASVTNYSVRGVQRTGSNSGASEILQLFKLITPPQSGSISRFMVQFDVSQISSNALAAATSSFTLNLFDAQHNTTLPYGYDVEVFPQTQAWVEGRGHDIEEYSDIGYCNWLSASTSVPWVSGGAVPTASQNISTFTFDTGHEDLSADVRSAVVAWVSGTPNHGFFVRISSTLENDALDYYMKEFHSRHTHYANKKPYLEVQWADFTGSLSSGSTTLLDPSGNLLHSVYDLRSAYHSYESVTLHVYIRPYLYDLATVATMSSEVSVGALSRAYYRIVDDTSDAVVVPFGTGTTQFTRMSYNDDGNYFKLDMSSLQTGSYRLEFVYYSGSDVLALNGNSNSFRVR